MWKSFRNLGDRVKLVLPRELNAYDILVSDWVVFSKATLEAAVAHYGDSPSPDAPEADADVEADVDVDVDAEADTGADAE